MIPPRQAEAFEEIRAWYARTGRQITLRELAAVLGVTHGAAHQLVQKLRVRGALTWDRRITISDGRPRPEPRRPREQTAARLVLGFGVS